MKAIITHTTPIHEDKVTILKGSHLVLREEEYGTICVMDKGTGEHVLLGAFKNCSSVMLKGKPKQPTAPNRLDDAFDMISDLHARVKDLEGFIPDIKPCMDAQQSSIGSLDATIQQFFARMHALEARVSMLDCPKPKPPVANPAPAPFTFEDGICYLNQAAIEKGLIIDSNKWRLTTAETPDGRTIIKGIGLGLQTEGAVLQTGEIISWETAARTEADSALAARIDTIGTHPGDPEYPIPADSGWQAPHSDLVQEKELYPACDPVTVVDDLGEAMKDDKAERETKRKAKQDMPKQ